MHTIDYDFFVLVLAWLGQGIGGDLTLVTRNCQVVPRARLLNPFKTICISFVPTVS
jgi:hypothetical protein